jgi:hypothetical protein
MHDLPAYTLREIGVVLDAAQLILLVAVAYLLRRYVQAVRQVHAIGRFWLEHWNGPHGIVGGSDVREVVKEEAEDR